MLLPFAHRKTPGLTRRGNVSDLKSVHGVWTSGEGPPRALHGGNKAHLLASLRFHRSGRAWPRSRCRGQTAPRCRPTTPALAKQPDTRIGRRPSQLPARGGPLRGTRLLYTGSPPATYFCSTPPSTQLFLLCLLEPRFSIINRITECLVHRFFSIPGSLGQHCAPGSWNSLPVTVLLGLSSPSRAPEPGLGLPIGRHCLPNAACSSRSRVPVSLSRSP